MCLWTWNSCFKLLFPCTDVTYKFYEADFEVDQTKLHGRRNMIWLNKVYVQILFQTCQILQTLAQNIPY